MRIPQKPPEDYMKCFVENMDTLIKAIPRFKNSGKYLHWDKLRHLTPPENLSHEQWWAVLKLGRLSLYNELPLSDVNGHPFIFGAPDPITEHLHRITQNTSGQLQTQIDRPITVDNRDRYIISSLMEEAITSSQLEGAATTRIVAKQMLRTNRLPSDRSEQMIVNNYQAMQRIREIADIELNPAVIFDLHRILTVNTLDNPDAAGRLRTPHEKVGIYDERDNELLHNPPAAEELPRRLKTLCDFANGKIPDYFIHPVIRAIILHFGLAYDHPFVDGNGRCARALFYWMMLKEKYWLFEFISISQIIKKGPAKYTRAFLYTETDENDLTYFILYHLEIILQAVDELVGYVARKNAGIRETEKLIRTSANFNHRQLALISHALRHSEAQYTAKSHQNSHGVTDQTARNDLYDLEKRGLLERRKIGKTAFFTPAKNLADKLGGSGE